MQARTVNQPESALCETTRSEASRIVGGSNAVLSLAVFAGFGVLLGTAVRLPAFGLVSVVALAVYAMAGRGDATGLGRAYDVAAGAVALQVGYFIAVLSRMLLRRRVGDVDGDVDDKVE
jgi:hypothetical protein